MPICVSLLGGGVNRWLTIDYPFSQAIKGVSCVLILMGHYRTYLLHPQGLGWTVTSIEGYTSANIALFFFMFFSGYGLSLKDYGSHDILKDWLCRLKKIYVPVLVTCIVMLVVYVLLPDNLSESERFSFNINHVLHDIHNISSDNVSAILLAGMGWSYWYVKCIVMFYSLFYLSLYLERKTNINQTVCLSVLMLCYLIWAYFFYGPQEAHYYRYPWVFMLGNVIAKWGKNHRNLSLAVLAVFVLTEIPCGLCYHAFSVIALAFLIVISFLNSVYKMESKALLFMGSISYVYYLCHQTISCTVMAYTGVKSLLLWTFLTILIAWGLCTLISVLSKKL